MIVQVALPIPSTLKKYQVNFIWVKPSPLNLQVLIKSKLNFNGLLKQNSPI